MAPPRKEMLRTLSTSHFRAIGRVAAQWSALELTLLYAIGKAARVDFFQAIILTGSQNAAAWCDILKKLTLDTKSFVGKQTQLDKICGAIIDAQRKRNEIVHASWHPRSEIRGGLLSVPPATTAKHPTGKDKVAGTGVPKRGKDVLLHVEYTSTEMLKVADEIAAIELDVFAWLGHWNQKRILEDAAKRRAAPSTQSTNRLLALLQPPPPSPPTPGLLGSSWVSN